MRRSARVLLSIAVLVLAGTAAGALLEVASLYERGDYEAAKTALEAGDDGARGAEELLWRSRLQSDPQRALDLLGEAAEQRHLPPQVRIRVALETAELKAARREPGAVLRVLAPLLREENVALPGAVYLQAGSAYRALGDLQRAREMLASIRPDDPAFVAGRSLLGEIGLQQNDPTLALRYYRSAASQSAGDVDLVIGAGLWEALRRTGAHEEADRLVAELRSRRSGSLALLEIERVLRSEKEELELRGAPAATPVDSVLARSEDRTGRYCLQLGAFSDRGLALELQQRLADQVTDLRIEQVQDARGQYLYKLRTGSFVNPALAYTEAVLLEKRLGIDVIVADLAD